MILKLTVLLSLDGQRRGDFEPETADIACVCPIGIAKNNKHGFALYIVWRISTTERCAVSASHSGKGKHAQV